MHGVTVVVQGASGRTWVGRYHEQIERGIVMHDVATHDPAAAAESQAAWIARQIKFGVRVDTKFLVVPNEESPRITRLMEFEPAS